MKKIYYADGGEVPPEDVALLAIASLKEVKKKNKERLLQQITDLVNKKVKEGIEFTKEDSESIVVAVNDTNKYHPFDA